MLLQHLIIHWYRLVPTEEYLQLRDLHLSFWQLAGKLVRTNHDYMYANGSAASFLDQAMFLIDHALIIAVSRPHFGAVFDEPNIAPRIQL